MKINTKIITSVGAIGCLFTFNACNQYLDIVPDNIATLEMAFEMRSEAEKYLYTCYSYMPEIGTVSDPAIMGGDELWSNQLATDPLPTFKIALGLQNANDPIRNLWGNTYQGIRVCNTFLENAVRVPDLPALERYEWEGEAIFLKAYYHFILIQMYGPVPLMKESIPVGASPEEVRVVRNTVDECFNYVIELLDTALLKLPDIISSPGEYQGRITKPIAAAFKAKVLVTAASPLYNGNREMATMTNRDGTKLFNTDPDPAKWERAVIACKKAIDLCYAAGYRLYQYESVRELSDSIRKEMTVRNGLALKWNSELIWGFTQTGGNNAGIQTQSSPNLDSRYADNYIMTTSLAVPLKIAEMFYTDLGVPIEEDKTWKTKRLYDLRVGAEVDKYYIKQGYTTVQLNFEREPRFYGCLGFDGGMWYGQGNYGNNPAVYFSVACRMGGLQSKKRADLGPYTGYFWKKCVHFENVQTSMNGYSTEKYPWPLLRLSDLYLLYAEAINEAEGPDGPNSVDLFKYVDEVRAKTDLPGVKYAWTNYTDNPKYESQAGLRDIIHRERLIELALEGQRFWDLRRWKEAPDEYRKPVRAFQVNQSDPIKYYQPMSIYQQKFSEKDYFWPIAIGELDKNPNLVQSMGW
jgi:hypothetical protein